MWPKHSNKDINLLRGLQGEDNRTSNKDINLQRGLQGEDNRTTVTE